MPPDQFIQRAAKAGKPVNIKKGQFLSPWEMAKVVEKVRATGNNNILVCERGFSFGYNNLVTDMRGLAVMRDTGCPVVFDATHSVQLPGGQGDSSGGQRRSSRSWRAPRSAPAWRASSWKPIRIRTKPCVTAPIPGTCI